MQVELRPYQQEAKQIAYDTWKQGRSGILYLATGTGKTVIAAEIAKEINGRALFLVHREELAYQTIAKFKLIWPNISVGLVKGQSNEIDKQIVVASVQTLSREKRLDLIQQQHFDVIFVDECHHAAARSWQNILNSFNCPKIGLTATPMRADKKSIQSIFESVIFKYSIYSGIKDNYLAPLRGITYRLPTDLSNLKVTCGDFQLKKLEEVFSFAKHIELVYDAWNTNASDKKTIVFAVSVKHAELLEQQFNSQGVKCKSLSIKNTSEERQQILTDFSQNKLQVLISCLILTEGFDEPSVNCVVMARPTMSESLYIQMIGRGLRLFPKKEDCLVIDMVGNTLNHNIMQLGTLLGKEEEEALQGTGKKRAKSLAKLYNRKKSRDYNWLDSKYGKMLSVGNQGFLLIKKQEYGYSTYHIPYKPTHGNIRKLNEEPLPLDWCVSLAESEAHGLVPQESLLKKEKNWKMLPPTEKQIEILHDNGLPVSIFRGECSDTLSLFFFDQAMKNYQLAKDSEDGRMYISHLKQCMNDIYFSNPDLQQRIRKLDFEKVSLLRCERLYDEYLWENQKNQLKLTL